MSSRPLALVRRLGLVALAATLGAASLVAGPGAAHAEEFTLRLGTVAPGGTPWSKQLARVKKRVKKLTSDAGDTIKVKVYLGGKLGSEASLVRRCQNGKVGGIAVSTGALGGAVPELFAVELPYLFGSASSAYKALDAAVPTVRDILKKKGFVFYLWGENGFRHFASKEKSMMAPSDLRGMKMRSQPAMPHVEMYKALGASASPISVGEVTSSLANNVVTGYDNTLLYAYATQWHKEVKYVTLSSHIYQPALIVWCSKWYDTLPADLQNKLLDAPDGEVAKGRKEVSAMNSILVKQYEGAGVQVTKLSKAQRDAFAKATASVEKAFLASTSADGKKLLQILKSNR